MCFSNRRSQWSRLAIGLLVGGLIVFAPPALPASQAGGAAIDPQQRDSRLDWWREARVGMFIHWGLYAVPAGEWNGRTDYGEWIRNNARIPIDTYDQFRTRFNPTKFDPDAWVRVAKQAGMKYIVITTKHHDGFALFDSKETDWDVMATPYGRDIIRQLADACARGGIRLCFYHSIMDGHHPDYLPRRDWEAATRPAAGADFDRYVRFMKAQLKELLTGYGPVGVLWFDGEWEGTWTYERGRDLYAYVRSLQPSIIINNRVGRSRGDSGLSRDSGPVGDFGTPEQEIPAMGVPGVDWETCMTMNGNWGYNRADKDFKPTDTLVRNLVDIASKGGNFLLNVGPTADGEFPPESLDRLKAIGNWMRVAGESIHGTQASPFPSLPWGRCTQRTLDKNTTRLYLHVWDRPKDGVLVVPGLLNEVRRARPLSTIDKPFDLHVSRQGDDLRIGLPLVTMPGTGSVPDEVIALDIVGEPDVTIAPTVSADAPIFVSTTAVSVTSDRKGVQLRVTIDGTEPAATSPEVSGPVRLTQTATVRARAFRGVRPVSAVTASTFTRVEPRPATTLSETAPGLEYDAAEGDYTVLPSFAPAEIIKTGTVAGFDLAPRTRASLFAMRFRGFIKVPATGVYQFFVRSDDGSRMWVGEALLVDNDGLHSSRERSASIALEAGWHPITVAMFEQSGGFELDVAWSGPGFAKQRVPAGVLARRK
jgi:alpha-L-fucosidase